MSITDLYESLRLETHKDNLSEIEEVFMESNGRISFILYGKKIIAAYLNFRFSEIIFAFILFDFE